MKRSYSLSNMRHETQWTMPLNCAVQSADSSIIIINFVVAVIYSEQTPAFVISLKLYGMQGLRS